MLNTIKTHVLLPLLGRVGTATATILIGYGLQADLSHQVGAFVAAAGGIIFDLCVHFIERRKVANEAVANAIHPEGGVVVTLEQLDAVARGAK